VTFPHGVEGRSGRFADRGHELKEQLLPMLRGTRRYLPSMG